MDPATLVLGLGNPLRGDDGVGPRLVQELNDRGLPPGVTAMDGGTGGLDLLSFLERWKRVVIVDAAEVGQEPGRFVRFVPDEVCLARTSNAFTLHNAGLSEVLALAAALDLDLPEMVVFGVQPGEIGWGEGLSPDVETSLSGLADAIMEELKGEDHAQDPRN